MMLNKRGSTLAMEEVVKFILGVIVIVFLLLLAFELFKIIYSNVEKEQAENTLENIVYQIERLELGNTTDFLIEGPKDWILVDIENKLCFCSAVINGLCDGIKVCKNSNSHISIPCDYLPGTQSQYSDGFCVYLGRVPFLIYLTKDYSGITDIDSQPPTYNGLVSSHYKRALKSLDEDKVFVQLLSNYISSGSNEDKQKFKDYFNSVIFIKDANSNGKYWMLQYSVANGNLQHLNQDDAIFNSGPLSQSDYAQLNAILIGGKYYMINVGLFYQDNYRFANLLNDKLLQIRNLFESGKSSDIYIPNDVLVNTDAVGSKIKYYDLFKTEWLGWQVYIKEINSDKTVGILNEEHILYYRDSGDWWAYFSTQDNLDSLKHVEGFPINEGFLKTYSSNGKNNLGYANIYTTYPAVEFFEYGGKKYVFAIFLFDSRGDEATGGVNDIPDDYIFVLSSKESKIGINKDVITYDNKFWVYDDNGMTKFYFKENDFVYGESVIMYLDSDSVACTISVGHAMPISTCEMFIFGDSNPVEYFVLGGYGKFMFFETMESYNNALNVASTVE